MKKLILTSLLAAAGLAVLARPAHALRDLSLQQQGELPRGQYYDLVDPDHVNLDLLVVKFVEDTRVRLRDGRLTSLEGRALDKVEGFLKAHPEIAVERLFQSMTESDLDEYVAEGERKSGIDLADMNNWYLLRVSGANAKPQSLLAELLQLDLVQTCYYEPIAEPATCGSDPSPATPNWEASQDYREAAPTGIDIEYAWAHDPTYGNGVSSYWFQDLEWGWCETHEDFASLTIYATPDSSDPDFYNHGTAVVSIVGACDDGKGVTGEVPDVHLTSRVVSNYASTADALAAIGSSLITGETYLIEMHAQGPNPGWTCVCNCSQFRYIAMEYWTANFDAILANSTNGKYCVEAAGNGSMDLDWSGYGGAFDLGTRDSQAIVVGAGTSGSVHNPECWTNHGTRISAYGWGDSVYAAGYGDLLNPAGCDQDYTAGFSGTSSASPIVTGAAISLALIHYNQEGSYLSPTGLRSRLQTNGTAQGPTDTWKEIAKLPNMKGILAPDLAPYHPAGWTDDIVPSNATGTTTVPANLSPAPATTYFDWCWVNWSRYATIPSSYTRLYRDDVYTFWASAGTHLPYTYRWYGDAGTTVRGGLHYIKLVTDPLDDVDESVEDNNTRVIGYRWDPIPLVADVPQSFSRAPKKNPEGYSYNARDGFGNSGNFSGWWDVWAAMPAAGGTADLDGYLSHAAPTSTSGWTSTVASSGYISQVDFVGCNNNQVSDGDWASVLNYNDSDDNYTVEGDDSYGLGSVPTSLTTLAGQAISAGEIMEVYEFYSTSAQNVYFDFDVTAGDADIAVMFYDASTTYLSRSSAALTLNSGGAGEGESGVYSLPAGGWYGIVVCKNLVGELGESASYSLTWGLTGDITANLNSGWTHRLVPRNSGVGTVGTLPAILNEGASTADEGMTNLGPGYFPPGSNGAYSLDGVQTSVSGNFVVNLAPGGTTYLSSMPLGTVKGGRHLVGGMLDVYDEIVETPPNGESNNAYYAQFAWAPYALSNYTPLTRTPAPNFSVSASPSYLHPGFQQDGYAFSPSFWSAVAAVPHLASEQLNTHGYDYHSTSPTAALIDQVTSSYTAPGAISYVMFNGNVIGNATTVDFGGTNNYPDPTVIPTGNYTVEGARDRQDLGVGNVVNATIQASGVIHTYDLYTAAGDPVSVYLDNQSGVNLGFAVYQSGTDYADQADAALTANAGGAGADESGVFTSTAGGWNGVAVYRSGTADLGVAAPYRLIIGLRPPAAITDLAIAPVDFTPGNATVVIDFTPVATDIYGLPLAVDHYRIYTVESNGYDFGAPYVEDLPASFNDGNGNLYYSALGWTTSAYLYLTAVDEDGVVLATSPGFPQEWLGLEPSGEALLSTEPATATGSATAAEARD